MDFSVDLTTPITSLDTAVRSRREAIDAPSRKPRGGKSYVRGGTFPELSRATVWDVLERAARNTPGNDAAVFPAHGVRWSWRALRMQADALAAGFLALGLGAGDRLGIWAPNRPEWLLTQFATARIGVILVTVNPAYRTSELEYALHASGCKALVLADRFKSSDYIQMVRELLPALGRDGNGSNVDSEALPALRHVVHMGGQDVPGMLRFDALLTLAGPAQVARLEGLSARLDADDAINIQFTSGTTGTPKGATLTHANIVNNAFQVVSTMQLDPVDRICVPVPLYHCFGMVMGVLGAASIGATMVFPSEGFEPAAALKALNTERCTAIYGVPTMFVAMLEHDDFDQQALRTLRSGIMAGAPCPIALMKRVVDEMHVDELTIAYGMTETSPVSFQSSITDSLERRVTTVGRVHPHVEVKVIGTDGRVVPTGTQGELCTRGYSVMHGYWGDDERTAQVIDRAGWMHTGDVAVIDEAGYCTIVGRIKDMLIRGGENIYPREIEEFLLTHPAIEQAQVFGIPDARLGEEICAWIVLRAGQRLGTDDVKAFCQGRIAHYKVPRHVRFVEALPMTVTGKPQKFLMRDAMMSELAPNLPMSP